MNKQVFIINGSGGVGKDAFIELINLSKVNYSSVTEIKRIAEIIGWDGRKTERNRKFLSDLKLLCTDYNNLPFNSMKNQVDMFMESDNEIMFLHIREPEEIEKARVAFNAKTLLIKRDSVAPITTNMADANVNNYKYDIVLENNGTLSDLQNKVNEFVNDYKHDKLKDSY